MADNQSPNADTTMSETMSGAESTNDEKRTPTTAGDPGATPGEAEGDEDTVEESIRQHEQKGDL